MIFDGVYIKDNAQTNVWQKRLNFEHTINIELKYTTTWYLIKPGTTPTQGIWTDKSGAVTNIKDWIELNTNKKTQAQVSECDTCV